MFGLLKKKIGDFISGLVKKEEEKPLETPVEEKPRVVEEKTISRRVEPEQSRTTQQEKPVFQKEQLQPEPREEKQETRLLPQTFQPKREQQLKQTTQEPQKQPELKPVFLQQSGRQQTQPIRQNKPPTPLANRPEPHPFKQELPTPIEHKPVAQPKIVEKTEERKLAPKLGLFTQVKSLFSSQVTIKESEIEPLLEDLKMAMLESDVSLDTAEFLTGDLKKRLAGKQVNKAQMQDAIKAEVKNALRDVFPNRYDLDSLVESNKPCVIMFVGPNGAGKTTTIAKISSYLKRKGKSVVLAASDSFRSGAIHQLEEHAEKLGVKMVKHDYGADPAAVAFDAIAHAKAKNVDVVLIDTAGRQETNYNLVKEMEKMNRVLKPNAKIFVGEAVAGHALVEQVKKFNETIGVDAIVLTKVDCDAKGGTSFSIAHETKIPLLYLGTGQDYEDLRDFDADWIISNVLAA